MSLIRALADDFRLLTRQQIGELFPMGSASRLNFRLRRLRDGKFLSARPILTDGTTVKYGYYLGPQAHTLFPHPTEQRIVAAIRQQAAQLSDSGLAHRMLVDSVHIRFLTATRYYPEYKLLTWVDQYSQWWATLTEYGIPFHADGYGEYLMLTYFDSLFTFFLEVDRGTERGQTINQKIDQYIAYGESGLHERQFAAKAYRVLVITSTPRRAESLLRTIEARTDKYFWITSWDHFREAKLFDPCWLRPHHKGHHSLAEHL